MTPSVSVVMSVYNGENTVRDAVESILAQTFSDFEFIIIDDGSTDGTPEILGSLHDSRVTVIRQDNAGLTVSLNRGVSGAAAPLVARMDADDISFPSRFEEQIRALEKYPDLVLVGSDADSIDERGATVGGLRHLLRDDQIRRVYPVGNQFVHGSVMFRREAFHRAGGYDGSLRYSQDFDLWWRMLGVGKAANLPRTFYAQRHWSQGISSSRREQQDRDRDRILQQLWREILDPRSGFPPVRGKRPPDISEGPDPHVRERRRFYARLLLRMGIGFLLHGDSRRSRHYFAESVAADPTVKEAWGCLLADLLCPSRLKRRCDLRAEKLRLYRTIRAATVDAERTGSLP